MAGFRDVLAHSYKRVDLDICWNILSRHLPETIEALEEAITEQAD